MATEAGPKAVATRVVSQATAGVRSRTGRDLGVTLAVTAAGAVGALLALEIAGDYVNRRRDLVLLVGGGLAITALALPARRMVWAVGALGLTWLVGWLAYVELRPEIFIDTPVDQAVGAAAYYGTPYIPQQMAGGLVVAAVVVVALAYMLVGRRGHAAVAEERVTPTNGSTSALAAGIGVGLLALSMLPDLPAFALGDPLSEVRSSSSLWDGANLLTWAWLVEDGAVAMKDFFWPYGQTWIFDVFPLGPLWEWLANVVTLGLAAWALWRLSPPQGRAARVILCALTLVLVGAWADAIWRYSVPLALALVYAAVGPARHRTPTRGHLVLALAAVNAALWGIDALVYGIAGMVFVLLGELLSGQVARRPLSTLARGLLVDALAMSAVLLVALLLALEGSLGASMRFGLGLRGVSAASALVQNANGALKQFIGIKPTYEMVSVVAPALLMAAGLVQALLGTRTATAASRVLFAAAGVSFAVLLKHLVRPQGDLMFLVPILVLVWWAILVWETRRWLVAAGVGALAATLLWAIDQRNALDPYLSSAADTPARLVEDVKLVGKRDAIAAVDRRQFQRANLPDWPADRAMALQLRKEMARHSDDSFAVLGDLPYVYVFFKERPPFHVELYDASTHAEQDAMVAKLEESDPNLILWRRDFAQDGVPQASRNPIVMRWVAERYVLARGGELSDVLRRRRPGERAEPKLWRSRLGESLPLGYVPAASGGEDADQCNGGDGCNAYAVLDGKPTAMGQQLDMTISGRGRSFSVSMLGRTGEEQYPVRLDRLWFASLVGPRPEVRATTPGFEASLQHHRTGDDLW